MPKIVAIPNSGSKPSTTQLALGDLAINTYDGKAYLKKQAGSSLEIVEIGSGQASVSASYADFAVSASYAATTTSASYSDYAVTSSYALNFNPSATASYALFAITSSYAESSLSSSYALSASLATSASYAVSSTSALSASYAATASYAPLYLPLTGGTISGDLVVQGTASVTYLITTYESSSIIYASGSTKFGDTLDDTHVFTGSLFVTGSEHAIIGRTTINDLTGSLFGTSSWAENAVTASYGLQAESASLVYINDESTTNQNFPLIFKGDTAALDDYRPLAADTGGPYYNPATNTLGSTGLLYVSASNFVGNLQGTASYALKADVFPFTGSAIISGSLTTIGDFTVNNANSATVNAATITLASATLRAPFLPLATPPGGTTLNTVVIDALSGTMYVTGSLPGGGGLLNYIQTGSIVASVEVGPAALQDKFFAITSGSVDMVTVNANRVLTLEPRDPAPAATTGSIFYSASGDFFFGSL